LLHHRRLVAELAGVKHRHGQGGRLWRLEVVAELQRRLVPGMAVGRDEAEANSLAWASAMTAQTAAQPRWRQGNGDVKETWQGSLRVGST
jgi:hypothetical protein